MKKSLLAISGALLSVTTTFAAFGVNTAFADSHGDHKDGWTMNMSMQGNTSFGNNSTFSGNDSSSFASNASGTSNLRGLPVLPPIVTRDGHSDGDHENGEQHKDHGKKKPAKPDKSKDITSKDKSLSNLKVNTSTHGVAVAQLHATLATFHQDVLKAQAAHRSLEQAAKDFITAMQDAVAAGDTTALQQGTSGSQQIISTLKQALAAQEAAEAQSKTSTTAANKGDLAAAITAIQSAEAREVSKTNTMNQAATSLEALAAKIENEVASYTPSSNVTASGTANATNTTSNNTSNTTVNGTASGNGIVSINNNP